MLTCNRTEQEGPGLVCCLMHQRGRYLEAKRVPAPSPTSSFGARRYSIGCWLDLLVNAVYASEYCLFHAACTH